MKAQIKYIGKDINTSKEVIFRSRKSNLEGLTVKGLQGTKVRIYNKIN